MSFFVYILRCADGSYYTGHTDDLEPRIAMHQSEFGGYTATRLPITLVFTQEFGSRYAAIASERQIKGWTRAKKEALIAGDFERLVELSRSRARGSTGSPRTEHLLNRSS